MLLNEPAQSKKQRPDVELIRGPANCGAAGLNALLGACSGIGKTLLERPQTTRLELRRTLLARQPARERLRVECALAARNETANLRVNSLANFVEVSEQAKICHAWGLKLVCTSSNNRERMPEVAQEHGLFMRLHQLKGGAGSRLAKCAWHPPLDLSGWRGQSA